MAECKWDCLDPQARRHTHTHTVLALFISAHPLALMHTDTDTDTFHIHTLPLRHTAYIQGDFGCRATDGEATALVQTGLSGSDSRLGRHCTLADQRPLMPTSLLPIKLSLAPALLTPL